MISRLPAGKSFQRTTGLADSWRFLLTNNRHCNRGRRPALPGVQPARQTSAEIARPLREEVLTKFSGVALQVALARFDHREQLLSFALPGRFSILHAQSFMKEVQIMCAAEQVA